MKVRVLDVSVVAVAAFLSWFATFAADCYYHGTTISASTSPHSMNQKPPYPGDKLENIFWFLQISDIHLSYINDMAVAKDFSSFCKDTISLINPSLVLVTGDLTHGKYPDERWSRQFEEEWIMYGKVLEECGVRERLPWLDIRGNHDNFDVMSRTDKSNRYRDYSMSWQHHGTLSYNYIFNTSFGSYNFVGLDACPNPGPRRPFNFFGILHDEDLDALMMFSDKTHTFNHSVWFSHYPSATISTNRHRLREVMSSSTLHICGHLHTLGNSMPHMYGHHPGGHLELELADFKDNRRYRLLAFDHDLFSFVDTSLHSWPLVLITNPKDSRFLIPSREPLGRMSHSTHVRLLVFSPDDIISLSVWVDDKQLPKPTKVRQNGPLYASPWQPHLYHKGLHTIRVSVKDSAGRERSVVQQFSLDGSTSPLLKMPQILLLTDLRSLLRMGYLFLWLAVLSTLLLAWCTHRSSSFFHPLVQTRSVYFPLLVYITYFGLGPWYIGEVITGVYGTVSVHGINVVGHHLPGSMTYLYGILQTLLFQVPLIYYLNWVLSRELNGQQSRCCCSRSILCSLLCHVIMIISFLLQCGFVLASSPYGIVAVLVSPGVSWAVPLSLVLIIRACRSPIKR